MRCPRVRRRLSAYLDGALGDAEGKAVYEHLARCPACHAAAKELQQTWDLLGLSEGMDAPPGFVGAVMHGIDRTEPRTAWEAPRWAVAAALALCLAFGGAAGLAHSGLSGATPGSRIALATGLSERLGVDALGPAPTDTLAGAYAQLAGSEGGR